MSRPFGTLLPSNRWQWQWFLNERFGDVGSINLPSTFGCSRQLNSHRDPTLQYHEEYIVLFSFLPLSNVLLKMNNQLRAPRAPTDQLRLASISILARLEKIIEFRPWIVSKNQYRKDPPYKVLFDSFSLGAPLGVLLDLLGSPAPSYLSVDVEDFDFELSLAERERFVQSFIQRVHLLEVTGRLSYGEIIRVDDLFNGTSSGFMKVRSFSLSRLELAKHIL